MFGLTRSLYGVECASGFCLGFGFHQAQGERRNTVRLGEPGREQWTVGIRYSLWDRLLTWLLALRLSSGVSGCCVFVLVPVTR